MKLLLTFCLSITSLALYSQNSKTDFLDMYLDVTVETEAEYERYVEHLDDGMYKAEIKDLSGKLKALGNYKLVDGELLPHGKFVFFFSNGQKESEGFYKLGYKIETWKRYMEDGKERAPKYYKSDLGNLIDNLIE